MPFLHRRVGITILLIEWAAGFVHQTTLRPRTAPTTTNIARQPNTALQWGPFGGKKEESESSEEPAKEVYATRITSDKKVKDNDDDNDIIDVQAAKVKPTFAESTDYDVIVVGAGCAGIGTALSLTRTFGLDPSKVLLVERGNTVGDSFRKWPEEMRFISPSFNQQGWTDSFDLNSIHYDTSPAFSLRSEHPTGEEYAIYLESIVDQAGLQVQLGTNVVSIVDAGGNSKKEKKDGVSGTGIGTGTGGDHPPGPFDVEICRELSDSGEPLSTETLTSRYIVWAAGEFQYPRDKRDMIKTEDGILPDPNSMFFGADLCLHNSKVRSWKELPGDEYVVVGGYESGMDAAINLARAGKKCKVLASTPCWNLRTGDPSSELAPYTSDRLRTVLAEDFEPYRPELIAPIRVVSVEKAKGGGTGYNVAAQWKEVDDELASASRAWGNNIPTIAEPGEKDSFLVLRTEYPPILCTGFKGSVAAAAGHLFDFPDPNQPRKGCVGDGPLLTRNDESTKIPGIFLVGPTVSHGELVFCFVYKFRQRFAVVANAICEGLGMDTAAAVAESRRTNMYLDNFATCEDTCGDAC